MRYEIDERPDWTNIIATDDNGNVLCIPVDPGNSDYQRYLRWLENPNAEVAAPPTE
jgi:hypothetical protein